MVHFNVSLGSAEETSAGYHRKVLEILTKAYAEEEARLRAARSQKKIPPAPAPSDKIPTAIGEPPMYSLISAAVPSHLGAGREAASQTHVAQNPRSASNRIPTQQYYDDKEPARNVPVYTKTALGGAVVGTMKVPSEPREDPSANFPFRRQEKASGTGTNIRASPAFLQNKSEEEVAAFLRNRRETIERERRRPARPMNVRQASRFLAGKLDIHAPEETGLAPEPEPAKSQPEPRKRKRKAEPESEPEPEPSAEPEPPAEPEKKAPAKRQKTAARGRKAKRATARTTKATKAPVEKPVPPAEEDLEAF